MWWPSSPAPGPPSQAAATYPGADPSLASSLSPAWPEVSGERSQRVDPVRVEVLGPFCVRVVDTPDPPDREPALIALEPRAFPFRCLNLVVPVEDRLGELLRGHVLGELSECHFQLRGKPRELESLACHPQGRRQH